LCKRAGLKKFKMPQTTQYPRAIPKTNETTMVDNSRNDNRTGVIYLSFYRRERGHARLIAASRTRALEIGKCPFLRYFTVR